MPAVKRKTGLMFAFCLVLFGILAGCSGPSPDQMPTPSGAPKPPEPPPARLGAGNPPPGAAPTKP